MNTQNCLDMMKKTSQIGGKRKASDVNNQHIQLIYKTKYPIYYLLPYYEYIEFQVQMNQKQKKQLKQDIINQLVKSKTNKKIKYYSGSYKHKVLRSSTGNPSENVKNKNKVSESTDSKPHLKVDDEYIVEQYVKHIVHQCHLYQFFKKAYLEQQMYKCNKIIVGKQLKNKTLILGLDEVIVHVMTKKVKNNIEMGQIKATDNFRGLSNNKIKQFVIKPPLKKENKNNTNN